MRDHFIKSTIFFQDLLSSYFQRITSQVVETLLVLSVAISLDFTTRIKFPMPWNSRKQSFIGQSDL